MCFAIDPSVSLRGTGIAGINSGKSRGMSGLEMYWEAQMDRHTLHLRCGEEFLSGLNVFPLRLRIGRAQVRVGGIGDVYTEEKHRLQGHSARCRRHAVERMRQDGFDLSLLFGIPDFYHRFGYATSK